MKVTAGRLTTGRRECTALQAPITLHILRAVPETPEIIRAAAQAEAAVEADLAADDENRMNSNVR
jgi:hypothetical protein